MINDNQAGSIFDSNHRSGVAQALHYCTGRGNEMHMEYICRYYMRDSLFLDTDMDTDTHTDTHKIAIIANIL